MYQITLTGFLAADAIKPDQYDVANFRVGSQFWNGKENETIWTNCALWGNQGLKLLPYLLKGTPVTIVGELTSNLIQTGNNGQYVATKVKVLSIVLHGAKGESNTATPVAETMKELASSKPAKQIIGKPDDLPF